MSNYYATLAGRFGIEAPLGYPLRWGDQRDGDLATILTDVKRTLPEVMKRVTLDDLLHVERERFGADTYARGQFGAEFDRRVQVSSFPAD